MPKQNSNPSGRVSVDLYNDKSRLDAIAKNSGTTGTNVARMLIRDGLARLESGEFKITPPAVVPSMEVAQ